MRLNLIIACSHLRPSPFTDLDLLGNNLQFTCFNFKIRRTIEIKRNMTAFGDTL